MKLHVLMNRLLLRFNFIAIITIKCLQVILLQFLSGTNFFHCVTYMYPLPGNLYPLTFGEPYRYQKVPDNQNYS